MSASIDKAVAWAVKIAKDDTHGYDQENRNSPDYDCSSFVGTALNKAGFDVSKSSTTRNLRKQLLACGFESISVSSSRKKGDIFLKEGHHVIMCVDEDTIVHASINELGKATGGETGDQTGKEICTRSFYTYSGGWDYHFRYNAIPTYKVGGSYTVQVKDLAIRTSPSKNAEQRSYSDLSDNAKKYDKNKNGAFDKGTKLTCKLIKKYDNGAIWIKCKSGWVCAVSASGDVYLR